MWKWQAEEEDAATNNKIILTHVAFKGTYTSTNLNINDERSTNRKSPNDSLPSHRFPRKN